MATTDIATLIEELARAETSLALFLDLDGTLIDIAADPESVRAPAGLVESLAAARARLDGALAIISGRTIATIDSLLKPLKLPAAGVHGAELRVDAQGGVLATTAPVKLRLVEAIRNVAGNIEGLTVELKTYSVAVHYRNAPERAGQLEPLLHALLNDEPDDFVLSHGRKVFEVTSRLAIKGGALLAFMQHNPFLGRRPVMIGDDVSDETAFASAIGLGGWALKVAGEHFPAESADFSGPAAVCAWLSTLAKGSSD